MPALDRGAQRASMEASQYGADTAKIPAINTAILRIATQQALLGVDVNSAVVRVTSLADALANGLLKRLRKHELGVANSTREAMRRASLLGGTASDVSEYFNALAMTVTEDETTSSTSGYSITTHGDIVLVPSSSGDYPMTEGIGNYTASSLTASGISGTLVSPLTFPLYAALSLSDVCDTQGAFQDPRVLRRNSAF